MWVWCTEVIVFIQECDSLLNCQAGKWWENRNKPGKSFYSFDVGKMINFHVDTPEETEMSALMISVLEMISISELLDDMLNLFAFCGRIRLIFGTEHLMWWTSSSKSFSRYMSLSLSLSRGRPDSDHIVSPIDSWSQGLEIGAESSCIMLVQYNTVSLLIAMQPLLHSINISPLSHRLAV